MQTPVIWYFTDQKPGHENQTQGLIQALQNYASFTVHQAPLPNAPTIPPTLLIGAGHATHIRLLLARKRFGGHSVVLMQPSLPNAWFDLCIIPAHDKPKAADNILLTQGVLNRIIPSHQQQPDQGLILLGGHSKHFIWHNETICQQVATITRTQPNIHWHLTTSRRTPSELMTQLPQVSNLTIVPHQKTEATWVPQKLQQCTYVWVSPDSVSMVYEAITAGSAVGLLNLPPLKSKHSRVINGLQQLQQQHYVTPFELWSPGQPLSAQSSPLFEADRCAQWIIKQWL